MLSRFRFVTEERESRTYIHDDCGTATEVAGNDYATLVHPYGPIVGTHCVKCGTVSIDSVRWADTGETVSTFRAGLRDAIRESSPAWVQKLPVTLGIAFMALFGIGGAVAVADGRDFVLPIVVGAVFGAVGLAIGFGAGFVFRGAKRVKVMSDQMGIDARHLTKIERVASEQ